MEEKILIKSEHYSMKGIFKKALIVAIVISILIAGYNIYDNLSWGLRRAHEDYVTATTELSSYNYDDVLCKKHMNIMLSETKYIDELQEKMKEIHPNYFSYALCNGLNFMDEMILFALIPYGVLFLMALIESWLSGFSLTVTNIRAYGKVPGKRLDLPLDSISSVGTSWLKGISIGTSSGKIGFKLVKNQDDVHSCISSLLMERSSQKTDSSEQRSTHTEELMQLKELLDNDIITQEEFDTKKKQLLGL